MTCEECLGSGECTECTGDGCDECSGTGDCQFCDGEGEIALKEKPRDEG